jgi:hypothetical protein
MTSKLTQETFVYPQMSNQFLGNRHQGFVIPIALGFGLVMLLIGTVTIIRSQSDKRDAFTRRVSVRSLNVSETGITRVRAFLGRYPEVAAYSLSDWDSLPRICPQDDIRNNAARAAAIAGWVDIPSDPNRGRYQLVDYVYRDGEGSLIVDGQINSGQAAEATTRLEVRIPVLRPSRGRTMPGLWIGEDRTSDMDTDKIRGDIVVNSCNLPSQPTTANNVDNSPSPILPPPPPIPYQVYAIKRDFPDQPDSKNAVELPSPLPFSLQLPINTTDYQDPKTGRYQYKIKKDDLVLTSGSQIQIKPPPSVTSFSGIDLFLEKDIDIADGASINKDGQAYMLRIFGEDTKKISIGGNAIVKALVDARKAKGAITGGGSTPSFFGSLWLKDWDAGSGEVKVVAEGSFGEFSLDNTLGKEEISVVQYWSRQQR